MYTIKLEQITKENKKVGGKGAHLGEMAGAGLPVPPGFVVTTDAYNKFIKENKLEEKINSLVSGVNVDDAQALNNISKQIEELIISSPIPDDIEKSVKDSYEELSVGKEIKKVAKAVGDLIRAGRETLVAVRSSATAEDLAEASFAGQMKTLLNVRGTHLLLDAIKDCWASLFTPRVIFYRKHKKIEAVPSIGVIVQKMINSEKAGVIFTSDPITNDQTKIVIEASWGLGQSVVSGYVKPDEYVLDKESGEILDKKINKKTWLVKREPSTGKTVKEKVPSEKVSAQVLDKREIKELWELAKRVEGMYNGAPQDIEWCEERAKMFLVQTRPITTLGKEAPPPAQVPTGQVLLEGIPASPGVASGPAEIVLDLDELAKVQQGGILVAKMTNPDFVPYMRKAAAIVTDEGGRTCHAAIVSRELGIPCVVGTETATIILKDDQEITVDATNGKVYSGKSDIKEKPPEAALEVPPTAPTTTTGEKLTATEIKVNIAFPETAERVSGRADGVGLLRAEHLLTETKKHPVYLAKTNPDELIRIIVDGIGKIAKAFYPKPVWYRTLDARTDEFRELEGGEEEPKEANPMLGWHGIRRSLDQPDVFKCEIEAIKRLHQQGLNNVAVMLPFVCKISELQKAKEMIDFPIKLGIMVETPAAALEIEAFCKEGIDFISVGSNDLTQLTLGIDRGNAQIAKLYSELDPAVIALIRHTIKVCKRYKVQTSICGEAGSNPKMAETLVELGIDSISTEMDALDQIRSVVARTERRLLLERARA